MEHSAGRARIMVIVPVVVTVLALLLTLSDLLWRLDLWSYDSIVRFNQPLPDDSIVIVAIDENSLAELGRWPWSRDRHARIIDRLTDAGVRGIVFDVMLAEADPSNPSGDHRIAEAIDRNGRVALPVLVEPGRKGELLNEVLPLTGLVKVASALGHTDIDPERDGLVRGVFLRAGLGKPHWSTLALAALEAGQRIDPQQLPGLRAGDLATSPYLWVRDHYVMLPQMPVNDNFAHISAVDLYNGDVPAAQLAGRWVLIGVTAAGLGYHAQMPLDGGTVRIPGIEYHARVLHLLATEQIITPATRSARLIAALGVILVPVVMLWRQRLRWLPVALAMLAITVIVGVPWLLHQGRYWLPPSVLLLLLLVLFGAWLLVRLRSLHVLAHQDPLTRLANRYQLDSAVQQEWSIATRTKQPLSLLLIDVDHFKAFNDRFGHAAGDTALVDVAGRLARQVRRPRDLVARYGGEEFAVILPDTDAAGARIVAEAMRRSVFALKLANPDAGNAYVTASVGISTAWPAKGGSMKRLFEEADKALYQAKNRGRNRVHAHGDEAVPAI